MSKKSTYKSLSEFKKADPKAYNAIIKAGKLSKICEIYGWKHKISWNLKLCIQDARKHKTRTSWQKQPQSGYSSALKNGWVEECCKHMIPVKKTRNYWTKEHCIEESKKYNTKNEWQLSSQSSYNSAYKNGWVEECCKYMKILKSSYTKLDCIEDAKKYNSRGKWRNNFAQVARKNGWYEECCKHMVYVNQPNGYWTKERCIEIATKYKTIEDWVEDNFLSYSKAKECRWMRECTKHMVKYRLWNKDRCIEKAKKYNTKNEWRLNNPASVNAAKERGWFDECVAHMK